MRQTATDRLHGGAGQRGPRIGYKPASPRGSPWIIAGQSWGRSRARLRFDERMRGFLTREATIIGVETTTSSPIRIQREAGPLRPRLASALSVREGGGHAGGSSRAIDGIRVAESVLGEGPLAGAVIPCCNHEPNDEGLRYEPVGRIGADDGHGDLDARDSALSHDQERPTSSSPRLVTATSAG